MPGICPRYGKGADEETGYERKAFALLMNVSPSTVRLWTTGAALPCGTARRLMQIYETEPEIIGKIVGYHEPAERQAP